VFDRPARTKDCRKIINCYGTIELRGIIKVVRKVEVVGVVCVVVEVKGRAERVGIALVCLRKTNRRQ